MSKFVLPYTDFGFKLIFGNAKNKDFLIDFLNELLVNEPGYEPIVDVIYVDKELSPRYREERGVIFDINCVTDKGHNFIVEMQNAQQAFFINRSLYYWSRAIVEQGQKGESWDYDIKPVFVVGLLNFKMPELGPEVRTDCAVCDLDTKEPISDKLRFIYIQLPNFKKRKPEECKTLFEQWIYLLKHPEDMENIFFVRQRELFQRLAQVTSTATLSPEERQQYDHDLKVYRDITNTINFAEQRGEERGRAEGEERGRAEGIVEMISSMFENNLPIETIAKVAKTTVDKVKQILGI